MYRVLQTHGHEELVAKLRELTHRRSKADYLAIRESMLPTDPICRAARFLYLVKLSHGNLYRTNKRGKFNVSYGNRPTTLCNPKNLEAVAAYLASPGVEVVDGDYRDTVADAGPGDVCYFDPPHAGGCFTKYTAESFDHMAYRDTLVQLDARGVKIVASNSDSATLRELFAELLASGRFCVKDVPAGHGFRSGRRTDTLMWNF